jgi:hypothetical protein
MRGVGKIGTKPHDGRCRSAIGEKHTDGLAPENGVCWPLGTVCFNLEYEEFDSIASVSADDGCKTGTVTDEKVPEPDGE